MSSPVALSSNALLDDCWVSMQLLPPRYHSGSGIADGKFISKLERSSSMEKKGSSMLVSSAASGPELYLINKSILYIYIYMQRNKLVNLRTYYKSSFEFKILKFYQNAPMEEKNACIPIKDWLWFSSTACLPGERATDELFSSLKFFSELMPLDSCKSESSKPLF